MSSVYFQATSWRGGYASLRWLWIKSWKLHHWEQPCDNQTHLLESDSWTLAYFEHSQQRRYHLSIIHVASKGYHPDHTKGSHITGSIEILCPTRCLYDRTPVISVYQRHHPVQRIPSAVSFVEYLHLHFRVYRPFIFLVFCVFWKIVKCPVFVRVADMNFTTGFRELYKSKFYYHSRDFWLYSYSGRRGVGQNCGTNHFRSAGSPQ